MSGGVVVGLKDERNHYFGREKKTRRNIPASSAVPKDARCKISDFDVNFSLFRRGAGIEKSRMLRSRSKIALYSSPGLDMASSTGTKHCS